MSLGFNPFRRGAAKGSTSDKPLDAEQTDAGSIPAGSTNAECCGDCPGGTWGCDLRTATRRVSSVGECPPVEREAAGSKPARGATRPVTADSLGSNPDAEGSTPSGRATPGSSSGRTAGSDPAGEGSNPSPGASLDYEELVELFINGVSYTFVPRPFTPQEAAALDAFDDPSFGKTSIPSVWSQSLLNGLYGEPEHYEYCSECGTPLDTDG